MGSNKKNNHFWLRKSARILIRGIIASCRYRTVNAEKAAALEEQGQPIIYIFWHRHIFVTIFQFRKTGARPLISQSADGEIVAEVAREFGMNPVRGSSSKGGARAFLTMLRSMAEPGSKILITADGPKGPAGKIKDGTIRLARKSGAWIVPVSWAARPAYIFRKSWDRFICPLPGGKIVFGFSDPVSHEEIRNMPDQQAREYLENTLDNLEQNLKSAVNSGGPRR